MWWAGRALGLTGTALFACLSYSWITLPDVRPLRQTNTDSTAFMRLRAREAEAAGRRLTHRQRWLPYNRVAPILRRAVLTAEDAGFWGHEGIDLAELEASLEVYWERGGVLRGGSTITQQLAKNLYLSPTRNPYRKLVELMISRRLEANLTKTRIFELYLNVIEWGDGIWGADAAARAYFGVSASDVSIEQAALLAGAIINPRLLNPAKPNGRLLRRQQIILRRLNRGAAQSPE
jgi:monofunctional biosynthetic peptidoglycan transglycosylase